MDWVVGLGSRDWVVGLGSYRPCSSGLDRVVSDWVVRGPYDWVTRDCVVRGLCS